MAIRAHVWFKAIVAAAILSSAPRSVSAQPEQPQPAAPASTDLTELGLSDLMSVEVVSAASLHDQRLAEAPASVTVVTAQQIRTFGYRTLTDVIRGVSGFFVTYDRNYEYLGVRGFGHFGSYNSRILVLVDGHRMNENVYDSANVGTEFIVDLDLIDRIEIVRGPSSSLYGTNALFAVVNVVTRRATDLPGVRVAGDLGSYGTGATRFTYGRTFGRGEVVVSGSLFDSRGQDLYFPEFDAPATNDGRAIGVDGDQAQTAFLRLSIGRLTVEAAHARRRKGIPTASFGTAFDDGRNATVDDRDYVDAHYESVARGTSLLVRGFFDAATYAGTYVYDAASRGGAGSILDDSGDGRWLGSELQASRTIGAHRLVGGTVVRYNFEQNQRSATVDAVSLDDHRSSGFWAAYAQDEFPVAPDLRLNVGVRHDRYGTFGSTTNPRAALIYTPGDDTTVKLLFGRAFRAPNAYELYYQDGGLSQKPAVTLEPETIRTYELAVERMMNRFVQAGASIYDYRISDLIDAVTDPADGLLVFRNQSAVEARGLELTMRGQWPRGWSAGVSHAFQSGADATSRDFLATAARHLTYGNAAMPLPWRRATAAFEVQHVGARGTWSGLSLAPFTVANLTLRRAWNDRFETSATLANLFDARYSDPSGPEHREQSIPQNGRNWRLKARYTF